MVTKYLHIIFLLFISGWLYSQEISPDESVIINNSNNNSILKLLKSEAINNNPDSKSSNPSKSSNLLLQEYKNSVLPAVKHEISFTPGIVSSVKNNIHFAGFWDHYAIINFTPQFYIQPFDFISIYANHSTSVYVPVMEAKNYVKSLAIEGAAMVVIESSLHYLLPPNAIIQSLAGFAAKNIAMAVLKNSQSSKLLEFKYYYYSVSIRF